MQKTMLNFTPQIELKGAWRRRYAICRFFVYLFFFCASIYLAYLMLFPSRHFFFDFRTPLASKNTLVEPRNGEGFLIGKGEISGNKIVFDAPLSQQEGVFSKIEVKLFLEKDSPKFNHGSVHIRKSFRSFFFPEGEPIKKAWGDTEKIGSSSLLAYGEAVYIIDSKNYRPIADEITFESMGFSWNDVIKVSSEELEKFEKGKMFTLADPHPDGTILFDELNNHYYFIENRRKRKIEDNNIIHSYLKNEPVRVNSKSLETSLTCDLKRNFSFFGNSFSCSTSAEILANLPGNNFEHQLNFDNEIKVRKIRVIFKKSVTWGNWRLALANIKKNIMLNYYGNPR